MTESRRRSSSPQGDELPGPASEDDYSAPPKHKKGKAQPLPISDFVAHSPDHTYIYRPTGEGWTSTAVNARVMPVKIGGGKKPLAANVWLDRNDAVEQRTWAPGEPQIVKDKLVADGGFFDKPGASVFNLYKPPQMIAATNREIQFWRNHLHELWPDEADHMERWFAHRVQRPGEKINHALVPGGEQGIGKDAVIAPLKVAVGTWNFAEVSPQEALGGFNEFRQSVVLRISEGKDLGDIDRFAFYDGTKTLIAAPPETLRVNPKFVKPYYVLNVTGVIITTNHKVGGLFLPLDDRRHFIAWSTVERSAFNEAYWFAILGAPRSGRRSSGRRLSAGRWTSAASTPKPAASPNSGVLRDGQRHALRERERHGRYSRKPQQARRARHQQHHQAGAYPRPP